MLDAGRTPLRLADLSDPEPGPRQILLRMRACGVCRTDLHIVDGELTQPKLPLVLGHQIVGEVLEGGSRYERGARVGVPWLGWTCGECRFCLAGDENLCDRARFTGYDMDGGYGELAAAAERYCFPIPNGYPDEQAAPLLCAGLIGYRSLRLAGDAERVGLYGFGASAHIVCQVAVAQGRQVFAGTRAGDDETQAFAPHMHETFSIGVIEQGACRFRYRSAFHRAPAGSVVLINAGEVHDGQPDSPDGLRYRMLYPSLALMGRAWKEAGSGTGAPFFGPAVVHDAAAARAVARLHLTLERSPDALERESVNTSELFTTPAQEPSAARESTRV